MKRRPAFTLIELLVVIAIIALLLAILMPSLRTVKERASSTVCRAHLRGWSTAFTLYNNDYDGSYHPGWGGSADMSTWWMAALRPYYQDVDELRCCTKATKTEFNKDETPGPGHDNHQFKAWGYQVPFFGTEDYGSYGINGWILNRTGAQGTNLGADAQQKAKFWRKANAREAANIPIIMDAQWIDTWPEPDDAPPPTNNTSWRENGYEGFYRVCVNRHYGNVGSVFMDGHARMVGLKELWTLKWHRSYNTRGWYTMAVDTTEQKWPDWMDRFKDY